MLSVIIPFYEGSKKIMNENLIVEGNTIYEIDPECLKKKREQQGKIEKEEQKKEDSKSRK